MLTDVCKDDMFQTSGSALVVTGSANEAQILESLERYLDRQHYVKKSLSHLFGLTQGYVTPRTDIIKVFYYIYSSFSQNLIDTRFLYLSSVETKSLFLAPQYKSTTSNFISRSFLILDLGSGMSDLQSKETFSKVQCLPLNEIKDNRISRLL
jgi:hypothetical protein